MSEISVGSALLFALCGATVAGSVAVIFLSYYAYRIAQLWLPPALERRPLPSRDRVFRRARNVMATTEVDVGKSGEIQDETGYVEHPDEGAEVDDEGMMSDIGDAVDQTLRQQRDEWVAEQRALGKTDEEILALERGAIVDIVAD